MRWEQCPKKQLVFGMKLSYFFKAPGGWDPEARPTKATMKPRRNVLSNILISIFYDDKWPCFCFEVMLIFNL